jgi:hypothetical protein
MACSILDFGFWILDLRLCIIARPALYQKERTMSHTQLSQSKSRRDLAGSLRGSRTRKHARLRHRLLQAERLEDRRLLSLSPLSSIPVLNSNPTAAASIYLDFNGHFEPVWGSHTNITTPVYDVDGDLTTFSDVELANIQAVWETVAEDYVPFNINVTTVEPSVLAPGVPIANANKVALRVAIGAEVGGWAAGLTNIGLAYRDSFTNSIANVAYVFGEAGDTPVLIGDVASHEAGHSFGLAHQTTYSFSYLMYGATIGSNLCTWFNGEIAPGVLQDDMAVLASTTNGFGYRSDDVGNSTGSATALTKTGNTWSGAGIVGTNTDVDMFSFHVTTEDTYRMAVNGIPVVSNLDIALELRNSAGQLIASANPQDARNAAIVKGLTPGDYYLSVKSSGIYGQIGQYTVSIDTPPPGITVTPASGAMATGEDGRQTTFAVVLQTQPTADVVIPITSSNLAEGTLSAASLVFTSSNWDIPQVVTITGVDDTIVGNDTFYSVVIGAASTADSEYSGQDPADIAVVNLDNDDAGFLYLADAGADTIRRSRLSGSQPETLVDLKALYGATQSYSPGGVVVDLTAGKMYWTDNARYRIQRANLDGSGVETLVSFTSGSLYGLALDPVAGKMYWAAYQSQKIQRANLDGSQIEELVTGSLYGSSLVLDTVAGKMYWQDFTQNDIRRANLDGTNLEILWAEAGTQPNTPVLDTVAGKMYWTGQGIVRRANLDGTNVEILWASGNANAIALDVSAGKIYWSELDQGVICRADLDGENVEIVVDGRTYSNKPNSIGRYSSVWWLTIDGPASKLYWADQVTGAVYRANLDGSVVVPVGATPGGQRPAIVHPGPEISVTHRTGLVTSEGGGSDVFRIALTTQPTADVTIALSSSDATEGTVSTPSVTFTPANWNVTQTVTITGVNDSVIDGDIAFTIVLAAAVSSDPNYHGLNPADVSVANLDDDVLPTKFYVVNDATQNLTYEYNASGGLVESYNLNTGNTAPRGAASTIAGDKTWVVDANRNVYVYNNSGGLVGSWTAGTLSTKAVVEGIATNGTDVWIVDAYSDKVYKYTGAATRLTGSQNAASSFNLNSGNTSPKDIVTNGVNLWVVNDSTTDRVFKYTVAGSLVNSWTISTTGATKPTGITIDPANVSNIWIVDSGADRVYQYNAAVNFTNGSSHAADVSFALAAGNTNPQGIADPPAPGSLLTTETPILTEPVSTEAALRSNDAALASMYYEPLKKLRVDTVRRSESRTVESPTRDLSYTVGSSANRIADDSRWARADHHQAEVDDLFAQWESDPLELLSFPGLGI